jgi:hypothetical protein
MNNSQETFILNHSAGFMISKSSDNLAISKISSFPTSKSNINVSKYHKIKSVDLLMELSSSSLYSIQFEIANPINKTIKFDWCILSIQDASYPDDLPNIPFKSHPTITCESNITGFNLQVLEVSKSHDIHLKSD